MDRHGAVGTTSGVQADMPAPTRATSAVGAAPENAVTAIAESGKRMHAQVALSAPSTGESMHVGTKGRRWVCWRQVAVPDWWWEKLRRKGKWRSDWLGLHRELLRKLEAKRRQLTQHSIVTVRASPSGGTGSSGPEGTQAECERPQESGSAPKMLHGMGGGRGRPWAVWDAPRRGAPRRAGVHARMVGVRDGKGGSGSCQCAGDGESACSSRFRF